MKTRCPSCRRKALRPRLRTNDYRCGACGKEYSKSALGEHEVDPTSPVEEDRCPKCSRKALSPRVRTKDFRCSGCATVFSTDEITAYTFDAYKDRVRALLQQYVNRVVPEEPTLTEPLREDPGPPKIDTSPGIGCVGMLVAAAVVVGSFFLLPNDLAIVIRLAVGLAVGVALAIILNFMANSRARSAFDNQRARDLAEADAAHKRAVQAAEAKYDQQVDEYVKWGDEHPATVTLANDRGGSKDVCDAALREGGTPEEQRLFARLYEELETHCGADDADVWNDSVDDEPASPAPEDRATR